MSWRNDRKHYQWLKGNHRCVECGCKKQPGITTVRCPSCNEKRNAKRNAERRKWYEAGLCRTCGSPIEKGHTRCKQCLLDKLYKRSDQTPEKMKRNTRTETCKKVFEKWQKTEPFIDPKVQLIGFEDLLLIPVISHPRVIELCTNCTDITCRKGICEKYSELTSEIKKLQKIMRHREYFGARRVDG